MNTETPNLEIRIHKLNHSITSFAQDDLALAKQILDDFNPLAVFNEPKLFLGNRNSHTVIPVSQIIRMDLEIQPEAPLIFPADLVEAVELTPGEFDTLIQNLAVNDQWNHLGELDAFVVTFLNFEMADGRTVLLTMEVDAESPQGLCELRDYLLNRSGLCFRSSSGGVSVLNLANLACLTFFPGTYPPPSDVWNVRRSDQKGQANPEDSLIAEIASGPGPCSQPKPGRTLRIKRL